MPFEVYREQLVASDRDDTPDVSTYQVRVGGPDFGSGVVKISLTNVSERALIEVEGHAPVVTLHELRRAIDELEFTVHPERRDQGSTTPSETQAEPLADVEPPTDPNCICPPGFVSEDCPVRH